MNCAWSGTPTGILNAMGSRAPSRAKSNRNQLNYRNRIDSNAESTECKTIVFYGNSLRFGLLRCHCAVIVGVEMHRMMGESMKRLIASKHNFTIDWTSNPPFSFARRFYDYFYLPSDVTFSRWFNFGIIKVYLWKWIFTVRPYLPAQAIIGTDVSGVVGVAISLAVFASLLCP